MTSVYIFGDIAAASQLTWDCYKRFYDDRQEPDSEVGINHSSPLL